MMEIQDIPTTRSEASAVAIDQSTQFFSAV